MKIIVRSSEHNIRLGIPTSLIFGRGSAFLAQRLGRKYAPDAMASIPPDAIPVLCAELRKIKRKYGSYTLAEVEAADGQYIKITL